MPHNSPAASFLDITGDVCPMTYVKTKIALEDLAPGEVLAVLLRGAEPLRNVTQSCALDGHAVLRQESGEDGNTRLLIQRGTDD